MLVSVDAYGVFRKAVFDTNLYVDWLNHRARPDLFVGEGFVRHLSAVVIMELRLGARARAATRALDRMVRAYDRVDRIVVPTASAFETAGIVLAALRRRGHETRRASLVNDVLIAMTCREIGATLYTADSDHEAIRAVRDFRLVVVP